MYLAKTSSKTLCMLLGHQAIHFVCCQTSSNTLFMLLGHQATLKLLLRFPALSLGFTIWGEIFCVRDRLFNPTIEVVAFRLRGWCMLGVFLLPAFTRLGHERQDFLSPRDGMHMCTDLGLYSHPKEFWGNGVRTHVNSKGKIPSTGKKISPEEDRTHDAASKTASPTHNQRAFPAPSTLKQQQQQQQPQDLDDISRVP